MQIHRSLGTSAIVALMAAHRAASGASDDSPLAFDQAAVVRIAQCLTDHAAETGETPSPRQPGRDAR
jgi:hypothetical protein